MTGLSEMDKMDLIRGSATHQQIPKEHKFKGNLHF